MKNNEYLAEVQRNFTTLLTIVMPVYERYEFFDEALDSALGQSLQCKIIVVDNGSSHDKFANAIAKRELPLSHLEFVKNQNNNGMYANWNKSVSYSTTEYTYILGDDDVLSHLFVQFFVEAIKLSPEIDLYCSKPVFVFKNKIKSQEWIRLVGIKSLQAIKIYAALFGLGIPTISTIFKTSLLKQYPFREKPLASMDWLMVYGLNDHFHIYLDSKISVAYRKHEIASTSNLVTLFQCTLSHSYIYSELGKKFFLERKYLIAISAFIRCQSLLVGLALKDSYRLHEYSCNNTNFIADYLNQNDFLVRLIASKYSSLIRAPLFLVSHLVYRIRRLLIFFLTNTLAFGPECQFVQTLGHVKKHYF